MPSDQKTRVPHVPIRTPMFDAQGFITRPWVIFFETRWPQPESGDIPATPDDGADAPACIGWDVQDSTPGTDISDPVIPPVDMQIADCRVRVKIDDDVNDLEFDIRRNGVSIFTTRPVIPAGTDTRDVHVFPVSTIAIAADDDIVLDIITGGDWQAAIYLRSAVEPEDGEGGGISSPLTTKGDIWTFDTTDQRLPAGTDGYVLTADSAEPTGLKWAPGGSGGGGGAWGFEFMVNGDVVDEGLLVNGS